MGLTSPALIATVAVIAAAALAAILWYWPKLSGRGVVPVVARVGALGVLQLSVLGLIFLIVNSSAEFYSSWSDLFGDQSGGGAIVAGQAPTGQNAVSSRSVAPLTELASRRLRCPTAQGAGGQLRDGPAVRSALRDQRAGICVPLPPGYGAGARPRCPLRW